MRTTFGSSTACRCRSSRRRRAPGLRCTICGTCPPLNARRGRSRSCARTSPGSSISPSARCGAYGVICIDDNETINYSTVHHSIGRRIAAADSPQRSATARRAAAFSGLPPVTLPPPPVQYSDDYARWQREQIQNGAALDGSLNVLDESAGGVSEPDLHANHPRPPIARFRAGSVGPDAAVRDRRSAQNSSAKAGTRRSSLTMLPRRSTRCCSAIPARTTSSSCTPVLDPLARRASSR